MLVLSRKVGERIFIGENVMIEVRRVAGNRVTIALDAPRDVRILRGELERAAREFDAPVDKAHVETPCMVTPSPALKGLPSELMERDALT